MDWTDRIGRRIKLRDLHFLLAVAKSGSMGKAAAELSVSQPVISKAISDLEHALGVRLLDRGPLGAEPTSYGRALLQCGTAVFDDLRQGVKQLEFLADPTSGELAIGCTQRAASGFAAAVIARFTQQYPRVILRVISADQLPLRDHELRQRNIELAITAIDGLPPDPETEAELLFHDPQVIMVGAQSEWARRRKIALKDLLEEAWILPPPESIVGASIAEAFQAASLEPPKARIVTFSLPLCHQLVATGHFVTMLPLSLVRVSKHPPFKLLPVASPNLVRTVGILTLRNRLLSPLAQLFIACARQIAMEFAAPAAARRSKASGRGRFFAPLTRDAAGRGDRRP
jgi:DNA-binding transcriptional LysR family regulator